MPDTITIDRISRLLNCLRENSDTVKKNSVLKRADDAEILRMIEKLTFCVRQRAQMYFALAFLCAKAGLNNLARMAAERCVNLYKKLPSSTLEDCATREVSIGGVLLPDFLYAKVAEMKFRQRGIIKVS